MRSLIALAASLALALGLTAEAHAGPADDVLTAVDRALNNFKDQRITFEVANMKPGTSAPQAMKFMTLVKGGKGFTEFLAPGDLKGTRVLSTSATQMWIWLPEFGKIRKVATHTLAQGFMGTTLSQQDMGTLSYAADYVPTIAAEDPASWTLDLKAKDATSVGFAHLRMTVDKKMKVPTRIEYLGEDGKPTRTQTRSAYTCPKADYCMFGELKMVDHTRAGAWTTLKPVEVKVDTGVSDDVFTPKILQLGL
jgi:outer membrane lipoprotein-sorting protein